MSNRTVSFIETFIRLAQGTREDQHQAVLAQARAAHFYPDAGEVEIEARAALMLADMYGEDSQ